MSYFLLFARDKLVRSPDAINISSHVDKATQFASEAATKTGPNGSGNGPKLCGLQKRAHTSKNIFCNQSHPKICVKKTDSDLIISFLVSAYENVDHDFDF